MCRELIYFILNFGFLLKFAIQQNYIYKVPIGLKIWNSFGNELVRKVIKLIKVKMVKNRVNESVEEQPLHDSLLELLHVKIKRVRDWNKEKNISIVRSCLLLYTTNGIWHKPIRSDELILACNQWKCKRTQECGNTN